MKVYLVAGKRTPVGSLGGQLSSLSAIQLGTLALSGLIETTGVKKESIQEVSLGNVIGSGLGQNPARQVAIASGLPKNTVCWNVNKVCASGMKSVSLMADALRLGRLSVGVAGGIESMSQAPHFL